jgi:hypothetical protein
MGICCQRSANLQSAFTHWSKVRITDKEIKKLIQLAMCPNKEVLQKLQKGSNAELSTRYTNVCDATYEYAMSHPSQQLETTRGTVFGAYNAITGYFQNVRHYKDEEARLKSILLGGRAQQSAQRAFQLCEDRAMKGAAALHLQ